MRPTESPELRVQSLQLDAGVGGFELPVGLGVVLVAVVLPCVDFMGEDLLVCDAAIQTLRREHAEFGFGPADRAVSDKPPARLQYWRQRPRWRPAESPIAV